jgi:apolipoprotein N-acyltransferase
MPKIVKIVIAVLMLLCLADMPYGFYELMRFVVTLGFGYLAYDYYQAGLMKWAVTFGVLLLLFQPFFKLALGRELWNIIDVGVAAVMVYLLIKENKKV